MANSSLTHPHNQVLRGANDLIWLKPPTKPVMPQIPECRLEGWHGYVICEYKNDHVQTQSVGWRDDAATSYMNREGSCTNAKAV